MAAVIYRGNDEQVFIRLWQDDNRTIPISIDDLNDLEVRVAVGSTVIQSYNKSGSGSFTALSRSTSTVYYFWFETDNTTQLGNADIWVELKSDNIELTDNLDNTIRVGRNVFDMQIKPY